MEKLKFALFSVVTLSLVGILGYWAFGTIQSGTDHALDQKVKLLEKENGDLKIEVQKQTDQITDLESRLAELTPAVPSTPTPEVVTYKYQSLINELQKLVDGNVVLKLKSTGTKVGTVEKFLNIYNNTSIKIDNDYGAGMVQAVTAFEKAESIPNANGEADKTTFSKMIDWLKAQG